VTDDVELHPPDGLVEVAEALESRGHEAWAVGGAVRDALMGEARADWDLATDARPQEVERIFRRTAPIGVDHGTVGVIASDGDMYEVTTFRLDVETDGRHAVVEFSDSIEEDLARRDFTINAVAWRPSTGDLRDPYGGREDLRRNVLRAVGDPPRRFAEDYLRVLRGMRFAGRYRMEIDPATREAMEDAVGRTEGLSAERIREELVKVLGDRHPSDALRLYREFGLLEVWYPEVAEAAGAAGRWELNLGAVDAVSRRRPLVRLARWLVPVSDDGDEREEAGRELMERLKFSNAATDRVAALLEHYDRIPGPMDSDAQIRTWLSEVGRDHVRDLVRLHIAGVRAAGGAGGERGRMLTYLWRRVHGELLAGLPLDVTDLAVSGRDLMELGVEEGPAVGLLLDELHAQALENPDLNHREELLELAEELVETGVLDAVGDAAGLTGSSRGGGSGRDGPGGDAGGGGPRPPGGPDLELIDGDG
jgi:tRNA nucleotidyltransferase/poly(A) polymerase